MNPKPNQSPSNWMQHAACVDLPRELFFEPSDHQLSWKKPPPIIDAICQRCVVKNECLQFAQQNKCVGVWGGTVLFQRKQLDRSVNRMKCPGCGSTDLFKKTSSSGCYACGLSW